MDQKKKRFGRKSALSDMLRTEPVVDDQPDQDDTGPSISGEKKGAVKADDPGEKKGKQRKPRPRTGWPARLFFFTFPLFVLAALIVTVAYYHFAQDLPSTDSLRNFRPPTVTYLYSDDGRVIGEYFHEHRLVVPLSKIPKHVIEAFIAAEDSNFYNHPGLDIIGIIRAFAKNMEAGRIVQGGSTITQQVTRSFLLTNEKTYKRKIREIMLAYRIEQNLTKDEILFLYLNQIYFGRGAYGVESAALLYFGKHINQLSLAEGALIAGLVSAPSRYSPFRSPETANARQRYVINRMVESGFITRKEGETALADDLTFVDRPNINLEVTPQFTEQVRRIAESLVGADTLYNDGLRIYTTVHIEDQQLAHKAVNLGLDELTRRHGYKGPVRRLERDQWHEFLLKQSLDTKDGELETGGKTEGLVTQVFEKKNELEICVGERKGVIHKDGLSWALRSRRIGTLFKPGDVVMVKVEQVDLEKGDIVFSLAPDPDAEGAFLCLENSTGDVKAMIGGRNFQESQFNRAVQAFRQPGSSFKPFVYAAAMDSGWTPASILIDFPVSYKDQGKDWSPKNYGRDHYGPMTLYSALTRSVNVISVRLLEKVGVQKVIDYAHSLGIESHLGANLSLALGTSEVTLLEMVRAYSAFPNLGEYVEPRFITRMEDRDGQVIHEVPVKKTAALSPETAYVMLDMLRGVVTSGTARRVSSLGRPVGGKTGTTQDQADAWFIGFTPAYTAGVWIGRDVRKTLGSGEQGGRTAAPVFIYFMKDFLQDKPVEDFQVPPNIVRTAISTTTTGSDGESKESTVYMSFKSGEVGRGIYSEAIPVPEEGAVAASEEAVHDIQDRMMEHAMKFKSGN